MRRSRIVGLLALLAGTASGCATATQRGDGLASIGARSHSAAPPQRIVAATSTTPDIADGAATPGNHGGVFARPEGLARFFPGLQKESAETPRVAKATGRTTWLGRRLRGLGQGPSTQTSLTYSTAPRSGLSPTKELGETSVLPVSLTLPSDRERDRDREVTPTTGVADAPRPRAEGKPAEEPKPEPGLAKSEPEPSETSTQPSPAEVPSGTEAKPEAKTAEPPASAPEVAAPAEDVKPAEAASGPELEPASPAAPAEPPAPAAEAPPALDEAARPSAPSAAKESAPAPEAKPTQVDARERPRLPAIAPRSKYSAAASAEAAKATATAKPPRARITAQVAKAKPEAKDKDKPAPKDKAATRTESVARPTAKPVDPIAQAAKAHAETAHILGLPDPTLPATYYRHNAPPIRGDSAVVATTASAPVAEPGTNGPCPHCGHDPHWRPSLQRLGRRILGVGEFAPPTP